MAYTPMRPVHNALVILAAFLVAGSLYRWSSPLRLACAAGAIGIMFLLLVVRLRAHMETARGRAHDETQSRIDRIRSERAARLGRRR